MSKLLDEVIKKISFSTYVSLTQARDRRNRDKIIDQWEKQGRPAPPPHAVKQITIEEYQRLSGNKILVETGTFLGEMVEAQRSNFEKIYSIELAGRLWQLATKRFSKYNNIRIVQGDSGKVLGQIVAELDGPAIFWLDGHYSAGITAKGDKDCPIYEELDAIFKGPRFNHVLIIDDAKEFTGQGDYPTIEALTAFVHKHNPGYKLEVKDNMIRYTIH